MKRLILTLAVIGLLSACAKNQPSPGGGTIPDRPDNLGTAEVSFELPKVERFTLSNGLVVFYKYDDEIPQVSGSLYFPGGRLFDSTELAGLAAATGAQLREGGVPGYPPEKLDKTLDSLAAAIESSYGVEFGSVSFSCLAEDFDLVFGLAAKVVQEPQFDAKRLELWKRLALDGIRRRRDDPQTMASMAFAELLYGKDSAFSHFVTESSIRKISRAEVQAFTKRFVRPNGSIFAVSGAIPLDRMKAALEAQFGSWARVDDPLPPLPTISAPPKPGVYVLEREFEQSTVLIGHLGPPRLTPDVFEMSIYNRILGSAGFGSRLFDEIRTQLGLAYDVEGGLSPGPVAGTFQIYLGTRSDEVIRATKKTVEITKDTLVSLPDQKLFADAKSAVERSFIFRFDSPGNVVQRAAQQELLHFPEGYDNRYLGNIASVTPERVRQAGNRWVKPKDLVIVIVGKMPAGKIAEAFAADGFKTYRLSFDTTPHIEGALRQ